MIYFSREPVERSDLNWDKLKSVEEFKAWLRDDDKALYSEYIDTDELGRQFAQHIRIKLDPQYGLVPCAGGLLADFNVFGPMGYGFPQIFARVRAELVIAGPNLRSWLNFEDRRRGLINLLKEKRQATVSIIMGDRPMLRGLGPFEEGEKALRASVIELRDMRAQLTADEAPRLRCFFDSGAATLSGVFIDPDDDDGVLFFTPRWGRDYEPGRRLTCMIEKSKDRQRFEAIWTDGIRIVMRQSYVSNLDTMLKDFEL